MRSPRTLPTRLILFAALAAALVPCAPRVATAQAAPADRPFPFAEADIAGLQTLMGAGELDSATLARAYLDRIATLDRAGPRLRAVLELNPDALREAAERDRERRAGHVRGPLHGIPVLLEDSINARPMATTAGSLALAGFRPPNAFLMRRLREAGAVVLGKANLSEWSSYRSSTAVAGWSARGGQTRNPYDPQRSPCGSSSGSAVAVAANLVVAAVGTGTGGSLLCPAAMNGVVALRPTVGLISRDGIVPVSYSQDTPGPLARTVADAAALLTAMAGRDAADPATATVPGRAVYDYSARLGAASLHGARIGLLDDPLSRQPGIDSLMQQASDELRRGGASVIRIPALDPATWREAEQTLLRFEFKAGLERYLQRWDAPLRSLPELVAFNRARATEELPLFGQELLEAASAAGTLGDPAYLQARGVARRMAGEQGIDALLRAYRLDALVAPTTGLPRPIAAGDDAVPGGPYGAAVVAGYPSLSVPMGHVDGLPVGLLFMGTAWSEPRLLELAHAYEQRTMARRPPPLDR